MSDAPASTAAQGTEPEVHLAETWGDFTKALAIYPETNNRVRVTLEAFRSTLEEAHARAPESRDQGLSVLFEESNLRVGSRPFEVARRPALVWLRARLDQAGLSGVSFAASVDDASLIAFSQRLLSNFLRKDSRPVFEEMWPETYPGISLLDRRFIGTFGRAAGAGQQGAAQAGDAGGGSAAGTVGGPGRGGGGRNGRAAPASAPAGGLPLQSGAFLAGVLQEDCVAERMDHLRKLMQAAGYEPASSDLTGSDIVRQVVEGLSAEAVRDRPTLVNSLSKVLDHLIRRSEDAQPDADQAAQDKYVELLEKVSLTHFAREGADLDRLKPSHGAGSSPTSGKGRSRDAQIGDDVDTLVAELQTLPRTLGVDIDRDGLVSAPELLAALLHYLVSLERPSDLPALTWLLTGALERPGPEELDVLRRHLDAAKHEETGSARGASALIRFLAKTGKGQLLRLCGLLDPDRIVASFPEHFGVYLTALDTRSRDDMTELNSVCERIGHTRVLDAAGALRADLELLDERTAEALLARPDAARLPLARLLLSIRSKPGVGQCANFLRGLDLPDPGAFLLYQLKDTHFLTADYLLSLMDEHLGRASVREVGETVAEVLCRHIRGTRDSDPLARERLDSIRSLARFPAQAGREMLQELQERKWAGLIAREPRAVRRLARSISKHYKRA